jgi:hypothetical protein
MAIIPAKRERPRRARVCREASHPALALTFSLKTVPAKNRERRAMTPPQLLDHFES